MSDVELSTKERKLLYFLAVKDIVEVFAETELGSGCEIDPLRVLSYVDSFKFVNDMWGVHTKEEIYQKVTDDILGGYPIWQLLKIPKWTQDMLEREFQAEQLRERRRLENTYKCYTCKWFYEVETSLGIHLECKYKPPIKEGKRDFSSWKSRREVFKPKKSCKTYETISLS